MPVMPSDFVESALRFSDDFNEMDVRNKVSRAYYGAYLAARDWQIKSGSRIPENITGGVHARLIGFFHKGLCKDLSREDQERLAGILSLAKSLRTKADYKLNIIIPASDGYTAIGCAQEISCIFHK